MFLPIGWSAMHMPPRECMIAHLLSAPPWSGAGVGAGGVAERDNVPLPYTAICIHITDGNNNKLQRGVGHTSHATGVGTTVTDLLVCVGFLRCIHIRL